jgi:DNA polymerase-3 subunit gamma/tau
MQSGFFSEEEMGNATNYQVLARKYRPKTFKDMIGQEALVQTLTNAFKTGRIAHAFVLTGIRGVGKTTTARIIARALNCIGADEKGGPTVEPCGVCSHCVTILEDRNQDVYEFDAASHTGVNDIREIIDNVRYKPLSARYKVYIIDEVHMLSNSAFNALLKTLEEPPAHVKFIFATTEIRKIPATILSRCQRFDLRRVSIGELSDHFKSIMQKEGYTAEEDALKLVAKISGGSVRDGLSVIDQALARSESKNVTAAAIQDMLGLASRELINSLFTALIKGDISGALKINSTLFKNSSEPSMILQDLLELCHNVMLAKHGQAVNQNLTEEENRSCITHAEQLDVVTLSRTWQMLQKGLEEIKFSQMPIESLEMTLIRISYAASLPSVEEIVKHLKSNSGSNDNSGQNQGTTGGQSASGGGVTQNAAPSTIANIALNSFDDVVKLCYDADEMMLYHLLRSSVQFVSMDNNVLALKISKDTPKNFVISMQECLRRHANPAWRVVASDAPGQTTIYEQEKIKESEYVESLKNHKSVQSVLNSFTDIEIIDIKNKQIV